MSENSFNLENNNCIYKRKFFYLPTPELFWSYVYLKDIYKNLKGIGKIQFVSELTILLNLSISRFHGSLHKRKKRKIEIIKKSLNITPYVRKLTLV